MRRSSSKRKFMFSLCILLTYTYVGVDFDKLTRQVSYAEASLEAMNAFLHSGEESTGDLVPIRMKCSWKGAVNMMCDRPARLKRLELLRASLSGRCKPRACSHPGVREQLEPLYFGEEWPSLEFKRKYLANATLLANAAPVCAGLSRNSGYYVDLGARTYDSSVKWFREHYPGGQHFHVHAFDIEERFRDEHESNGVIFHRKGVSVHQGVMSLGAGDMKGLSIRHDVDEKEQVQTVNISEWIINHLPVDDPSAYIVLKMDIEGMEHEVIPQLISTGAVCGIDELFLECHYSRRAANDVDRSKRECDGSTNGQPVKPCMHRDECLLLIETLRTVGVYAHEWT